MLKIRLRRMGARHDAKFRVVVSDSRLVPTGEAVEEIGYYDPGTDPPRVQIDRARVEHWTSRGAQVSDTVSQLLKRL